MPSPIVVDGDGHVCEPADLWETRLPPHLRERGIRLRWNEETGYDVAHCEDWIITDRGLAGLGNAAGNNVELGKGTHYQDHLQRAIGYNTPLCFFPLTVMGDVRDTLVVFMSIRRGPSIANG